MSDFQVTLVIAIGVLFTMMWLSMFIE